MKKTDLKWVSYFVRDALTEIEQAEAELTRCDSATARSKVTWRSISAVAERFRGLPTTEIAGNRRGSARVVEADMIQHFPSYRFNWLNLVGKETSGDEPSQDYYAH